MNNSSPIDSKHLDDILKSLQAITADGQDQAYANIRTEWMNGELVGTVDQITFESLDGKVTISLKNYSRYASFRKLGFNYPNEVFISEFLLFHIRKLRGVYKGLDHTKIFSKIFGQNKSIDLSYPFRFIQFLLDEARNEQPSYSQHFWYKSKSDEKMESHSVGSDLLIVLNQDFFCECFYVFTIEEFPTSAIWLKKRGFATYLPYKHHYLKFGDFLLIEHTTEGIRWDFKPTDTTNKVIVESSRNCGISASEVFKRAIARFNYSKENPYLLFRNNCEHFGTYCFYGAPRSRQSRIIFTALLVLLPFWRWAIAIIGILLLAELLLFRKHLKRAAKESQLIEKRSVFSQYLLSFTYFPR